MYKTANNPQLIINLMTLGNLVLILLYAILLSVNTDDCTFVGHIFSLENTFHRINYITNCRGLPTSTATCVRVGLCDSSSESRNVCCIFNLS